MRGVGWARARAGASAGAGRAAAARAVALGAAAAAVAAGCGGTAGDLLKITVAGGPTNEAHTIVVSGDGRGSCDRGALEPLPSRRVIEAREVERDLRGYAHRAAAYPPRQGARRYGVNSNDGVVRWSEGTPGLPGVLPRAQLLTLKLERQLCR
jgi:subtilisin family serine protease